MRPTVLTAVLIVSSFPTLAPASDQPGVVQEEFIFESAPFRECHASTIVETPRGLVSAWFGGTREGYPDVGIWLSRQIDGKWSAPGEVANGIQYANPDGSPHRYPCWNPVLFLPAKGPVLLFYKCGPTPSTWWGMLKTSEDHGESWSTARRLPDGILGPVKNKPIQLADGTILCGSSTELGGWRIHMEWTKDLGRSWFRTGDLAPGLGAEAIQPCFLKHGGGRLQILCRDQNDDGELWQAFSTNGGKSWSPLEPSGLRNPNAGTDSVTLKDGRHLLVYNHTNASGSPSGREMLNVAVSHDGKRWKAALMLDLKAGAEFSYPAVIQAKDGRVHVTYTWKRKRVKHVVIDPKRLELRELEGRAWPE